MCFETSPLLEGSFYVEIDKHQKRQSDTSPGRLATDVCSFWLVPWSICEVLSRPVAYFFKPLPVATPNTQFKFTFPKRGQSPWFFSVSFGLRWLLQPVSLFVLFFSGCPLLFVSCCCFCMCLFSFFRAFRFCTLGFSFLV